MEDFSIETSYMTTRGQPWPEFSASRQIGENSPFASDSISSMKNVSDQKIQQEATSQKNPKGFFEKIALSISAYWSSLFKEKEQFDGHSKSSISIEDKSQKTKQHFHREMNEMYRRILEIDDDYKELLKDNSGTKEALLMKLLFLSMRNQLKLKDDQGFLILEKIEAKRKDTLEINKSEKKIREELALITAKSSLAGKLDAAFFVASVVVVLNGFDLLSNNPNIKKLIPHVQALASFAKSGNILLDSYKKGDLADKEKEAYLLRVKKDLAQDGIEVNYEQLNQVTEEISLMWQHLRELLDKEKQTSSEMLK